VQMQVDAKMKLFLIWGVGITSTIEENLTIQLETK
jgi:hypothetical protein